jgi:predicted metal-binding protein
MDDNYLHISAATATAEDTAAATAVAAAASGVPVHEWAHLKTSALPFSAQMLDYCKANACGKYNKSWACPPACGTIEEQKEKILQYDNVLIFTTKHSLEDSFDHDGMAAGREQHSLLAAELRKRLGGAPVYSAGACPVCGSCAFPDPCPFPEKMFGSVEAAGIDVTVLSKTAGIAYNNGPNTVTYFSIILLN